MDPEEITQFLAASRIALMATINRDGTPQLTPNWYYYDGKVLTFVTTRERVKYFNLSRDNRISVCICQSPLAEDYVVIKGTATISDQDIWDDARKVIRRYVGTDQVDAYVERWKTQPRVLVTVTPRRITTRNR
jgi:PPOX class probable F420-dependent enzyme